MKYRVSRGQNVQTFTAPSVRSAKIKATRAAGYPGGRWEEHERNGEQYGPDFDRTFEEYYRTDRYGHLTLARVD